MYTFTHPAGSLILKHTPVSPRYERNFGSRVTRYLSSFHRRRILNPRGHIRLVHTTSWIRSPLFGRYKMMPLARSRFSMRPHEIHSKVHHPILSFSPSFIRVTPGLTPCRDSFGIPSVQQTALKMASDIFSSTHANATRSEHAAPFGPPVSPQLRCVVHHWLGVVPIGGASIVIAVSSHQKKAFVAC